MNNINVTPGTGATIAAEDIGSGVLVQRVKVAIGNSGVDSGDVSLTNPMPVDGSGVTQPISASSLPLPSGAATETTLSGINTKLTTTANGLKVDGSAVTQPISGTITAVQTTPSNLNATIVGTGTFATQVTSLPSIPAGSNAIGSVSVSNFPSTQAVSAASLPLPSGASTAVNQTTANSSLSSIDTKLPSNLTVTSTRLLVDGSGVTQPISAASLPLPSGAATETTLSAINGKLNSLGQKTMSGSVPVVFASDQSALTMSASLSGDLQSSFMPDPFSYNTGSTQALRVSSDGSLQARANVLTDAESFRDGFPGSSLLTTLTGTIAFTNGSTTITGTGSLFLTEVPSGAYIKYTSHSETVYAIVASVESNTSLTLESAYTGATISGTGVISNWKTVTGSGSTIAVSSSNLNLTMPTTTGITSSIIRHGDYGPVKHTFIASLNNRRSNQTIRMGLAGDLADTTTATSFFQFTGTTNTTVTCVTSQSNNNAQQTTSVTLPSAATTASSNTYSIGVSDTGVTFIINGFIVAQHTDEIPTTYDSMNFGIYANNTGTVAGTTTISLGNVHFKNYDQVEISTSSPGQALYMQGNTGAGFTDIGNPVKVGGVYNSTSPTLTTGQRGDLQLDASGNLLTSATVTGTIAATQSGTWNINNISGTVSLPTGAATAANQTSIIGTKAAGTAATNSMLTGAVYNSTLPTLTTGQQAALQVTSSGKLITDSSSTTQPVSGTVTASQATASSLNATVVGTGTFATQVTSLPSIPAGSNAIGSVSVSNFPATTTTVGTSTPADGASNPTTAIITQSHLMGWNGATWDRVTMESTPSDGDTTPTTMLAVENYNMVFNGSTWDRARGTVADGMVVSPSYLSQATYSASSTFTLATLATDIFTITGSASKTIKINKIIISATQTTASIVNISLIKRSTANTGGTSSTLTNVPHDSSSAAATATVRSYTANPTLGTTVGTIRSIKKVIPVTAPGSSATQSPQDIIEFGSSGQPIYLRGTSEVLSVNIGSVTIAGSSFSIDIEWTEI